MNGKKIFAIARIGAAVIAAVVLLACTGWAFVYLLGAPEEITQGAELTDGAYVTADVSYLMDICGVERVEGTGEAAAYFAIAPIGNQFVVLRFPAEEYDTIAAFEADTQAYLDGTRTTLPFRMSVTGMARELEEPVASLLSSWFSSNANRMSQSGLIAAVEDYGAYLCGCMIDTGSTGSVSVTAAVVMTVIAAVLIVYAVVELVLLFVPKRPKPEMRVKEVRDA